MGMEVAGQRLTFPFPFVHQQPHDCGNKTINRWETSLWNLSYNLSAVNLVSLSLLFPIFYYIPPILTRFLFSSRHFSGGTVWRRETPWEATIYTLLRRSRPCAVSSSFIFSFSLLFFVWKGKSIEEKMKKKPSRSHRSVWTPAMSSGVFKAVTTGNWCLWKFIPFLFVLWNKLTGIQLRLNICNSRGVESCPLLDWKEEPEGEVEPSRPQYIYYLSPGRGWDRGTTVSGRGEVGVERELEVVGVLK